MKKLILAIFLGLIFTACSNEYYDIDAIGVPFTENDFYITNISGHFVNIPLDLLFIPRSYSLPNIPSPLYKSRYINLSTIHFGEDVGTVTTNGDVILSEKSFSGNVYTPNDVILVQEYSEINVNGINMMAYTYHLPNLTIYCPNISSNYTIIITNFYPQDKYDAYDQNIYKAIHAETLSKGRIFLTVLSNTNKTILSNNITLLSNRLYKMETFSRRMPVALNTLIREHNNFGILKVSGDGQTWTDFKYIHDTWGTDDGVNNWDVDGYIFLNNITNIALSNYKVCVYVEKNSTVINYALYNPVLESFGFMGFNFNTEYGWESVIIQ